MRAVGETWATTRNLGTTRSFFNPNLHFYHCCLNRTQLVELGKADECQSWPRGSWASRLPKAIHRREQALSVVHTAAIFALRDADQLLTGLKGYQKRKDDK